MFIRGTTQFRADARNFLSSCFSYMTSLTRLAVLEYSLQLAV